MDPYNKFDDVTDDVDDVTDDVDDDNGNGDDGNNDLINEFSNLGFPIEDGKNVEFPIENIKDSDFPPINDTNLIDIPKAINTLSDMRVELPHIHKFNKAKEMTPEMKDALLGKKRLPKYGESLPKPGNDATLNNRYIGKESNYRQFLCYQKIHPDAAAPTRATPGSVGYDLYACNPGVVPAWGKMLVPTGLKLVFPSGCYGRICPRSGLSLKNNIEVGAGLIDMDYQEELGVVLRNFSDTDFNYSKGDRIAQLVLEKSVTPATMQVINVKDIAGKSARIGGFGSTGI